MIERLLNARTLAGANLASTAALARQGRLRVLTTSAARRMPGLETLALPPLKDGDPAPGW